jgi:hypothetical protein
MMGSKHARAPQFIGLFCVSGSRVVQMRSEQKLARSGAEDQSGCPNGQTNEHEALRVRKIQLLCYPPKVVVI